MATNREMSEIQSVQTNHRVKLAEFWNIRNGNRILEIGCGQGDTTAVLAYFVGEKGLVHGIDIGSPTYGSPITLGDSAEFLKKSVVGKQIKMDFEVELLSPQVDFPENFFDQIVLSHCSWYLKSSEELRKVLKKVRKWGKTLCFAEWDPRIKMIGQHPHLLSCLIQAQYESFKVNSDSNVRTLFTPEDIKAITIESGWNITKEKQIHSPELQDGEWEVNKVLIDIDSELAIIEKMPSKLKELIQSEVLMLKEATKDMEIMPMSTFAFLAEK